MMHFYPLHVEPCVVKMLLTKLQSVKRTENAYLKDLQGGEIVL